jgi:invasion protein IalB
LHVGAERLTVQAVRFGTQSTTFQAPSSEGVIVRNLFKIIGALAASLCLVAGASSASAASQGQKFGSWTVGCEDNGKICHIGQKIVTKEGGQLLLELGVGIAHTPDGSKMPRMIILAPLGVLLPQQMILQVDQKQPVKLPFLQCAPAGCRVVVTLEDEALQTLKAGSEAKFTFYAPNGKPITVPISLSGFTAGYTAVTN